MAGETQDPHVLEPGHAPTPFLAEEIRDATPPGRSIRIQIDVAGETSVYRINRYVACDPVGATLERTMTALDGSPLGEPDVGPVTWLQLQAHASFPADATTIETERIDTEIGTYDCLRYTVRDGTTDEIFWFATDLPGMPIRYLTRVDGQVVTTVSVVERTTPTPEP